MDPALRGVPAAAADHLRAAEQALQARDAARAIASARAAVAVAPDHPETLRCLARALSAQGPSPEALAAMRRAAAAAPDDAAYATTLGVVLEVNGERDAALLAFRRACALAPDNADLAYNLGRALSHAGELAGSQAALERALQLAPGHWTAAAALIEVLRQRGRADEAVAQCRALLARNPADGRIWSALAGMRQARFDEADRALLQSAFDQPQLDLENRVRIGFALGKACEDVGRFDAAFAAYREANALVRRVRPWNAAAHSAEVDAILAAFARVTAASDAPLGDAVILLVSLPRAGSTLAEQILASHADVEGGGERLDLLAVIGEEGQRRRQPLAQWAPLATAADWRRLGERYLERTAALRARRPRFTDKLPGNWLWLGAAMAMLPGARIVECRRDLLETAWSCYCQLFAGRTQEFSYDIDSLGAFVRDYERSMRQWHARQPQRIYRLQYEALVADFEPEVRRLLAHCGLPFDPACLRFFETRRDVRTISSTQVREPLRTDTARTANYGALLDPLRAALGLSPFAGAA